MDSVEMVIRREGQGTYGLGEVVIPGVTLFRAGADWQNYNLDLDGLQQAIRRQKKATISQGNQNTNKQQRGHSRGGKSEFARTSAKNS